MKHSLPCWTRSNQDGFAKWVFLFAGITGVLMVIPPYFLEEQFGRDHPPPINHPE